MLFYLQRTSNVFGTWKNECHCQKFLLQRATNELINQNSERQQLFFPYLFPLQGPSVDVEKG